MIKTLHFIIFIHILSFTYAHSNFATLRTGAISYIENNDADNAISLLNRIIADYKKSPEAIVDIYLLRSKLYTAIGKYDLAENDIDTYLLYDSSCAAVYVDKITLLDNQQKKLSILNTALEKLPNDELLSIQKCIVKIGITSNYWQTQSYNNIEFDEKKANNEIAIAKNGCRELLQLANNSTEASSLYIKICKIINIKTF